MATTYLSDYDPLNSANYDPHYTANISNSMQVPDSIQMGSNQHSPYHPSTATQNSPRTQMKVPERILLAGGNEHVGMREEYKNLDLDLTASISDHVGLSTPPRVLTVEDAIANLDQTKSQDDEERIPAEKTEKSFLNGVLSLDTSYRSVSSPLPLAAELMTDQSVMNDDDTTSVKRHISRLQRHVIQLEEDNYYRSRREMILYPTLLFYFLFQIGKWFLRRD